MKVLPPRLFMALLSRKKATEILSTEHGLRIVILKLSEVEESYYNSNKIVVKSGLKSLTQTTTCIISSPTNSNTVISNNGGFNSFLKSCHLCKKPLCPDKDVYMYRGDQGFCSTECRSKQIMVDESKEMDSKTKYNKLRTSMASINCQGCETCKLLEDLRRRRNLRNNKFKPLITPTKHQQPLLSFS